LSNLTISDKDKIFTKYPWVGKTLEIDCGDAKRIKIARDRGHSIWGLEKKDFKPSWSLMGIDHFIKQGVVTDIPYPDKTFDFVICPDALKPPESISTLALTATWYGSALREIYRVGRKDFFIKLPSTYDMKTWLKHLITAGFNVIMMQKSLQGNYLVEANSYV